MQVKVSGHAIYRYRARCFDFISSDKQIIERLEEAAREGKVTKRRHKGQTLIFEIEYEGMSIIMEAQPGIRTVRTCLGTKEYRNWKHGKGR